ncbi:proton-coupled amino acid transporter 1 isoform X2 [Cephus cinctus]|uniref:Proton-coupled amino acid transporter 1 isoform X2 n=1 Tax=Cephus cinctus TaxID=211228 RepID=A0AAJ7C6E4_CEPCN|nr:proton-coupled amino acid transporter 1 isoform X2 [Cephus cinctus]
MQACRRDKSDFSRTQAVDRCASRAKSTLIYTHGKVTKKDKRNISWIINKMELHTKPNMSNQEKNAICKVETAFKETTKMDNQDIYGAFQSKDLIVGIEKSENNEAGDSHPTSDHPTSYLETLMHLFKGNVGSGIFALGDAFKNAGIILGPCLTLFLGFICVHAQHMLLNCNEEVRRRVGDSSTVQPGFAGTVELCFATGPLRFRKYSVLIRKLVNVFLCVTQLGFCCVYFVFISKNMNQVLSVYEINISVGVLMAIVLIPIMLSTWIRNLKYLVPLSSIANFLIIVGYIATMYIMSHDLPPIQERKYVASWSTLPLFFGTVIYSFEGITLVLPLKNEMKKPKNFDKPFGVLNVGMVIVAIMFVAIGFFAYLKYGDDVQGSVTLNLGSAILPQCIKICICISILFTYALQFYIPVAIIWPGITSRFGPFAWPTVAEICFRSLLCLVTFILAEAIPHLNLFISLVGAVSSTALALLFPPIIEMVVCWQSATLGIFTITKDILILLIGLLGFVTGTYESITSIVEAFSKQ